jgi:hypothetical protein
MRDALSTKDEFRKAVHDYNGHSENAVYVDEAICNRLYLVAGELLNCSDELPADTANVVEWLFQRPFPLTYGEAAQSLRDDIGSVIALNEAWKAGDLHG